MLDGASEQEARTALAALASADDQPNASMQAIAAANPGDPGWTVTGEGGVLVGAQVERRVVRRARQLARRSTRDAAAGRRRRAGPGRSSGPNTGCASCCSGASSEPGRRARTHRPQWSRSPSSSWPRRSDPTAPRRWRTSASKASASRSSPVTTRAPSAPSPSRLGTGHGRSAGRRPQPGRRRRRSPQPSRNGSVFGRVTPHQKRAMVGALQAEGHTVAMTGDGVNDVLALKDADVGVAMGSGSAATRSVAQLVLLDNRFAVLPDVVAEGRKVIGNIERVAKLFLTKTAYGALMAITTGHHRPAVPVPAPPPHDRDGVDDRDPVVRPRLRAEPRPGGARHGRQSAALQHPGRGDRHRLLLRQLLGRPDLRRLDVRGGPHDGDDLAVHRRPRPC